MALMDPNEARMRMMAEAQLSQRIALEEARAMNQGAFGGLGLFGGQAATGRFGQASIQPVHVPCVDTVVYGGVVFTRPETYREELQSEVNDWLSDALESP